MKRGIPAFLKWAGGKRQLIPQIDQYLPSNIDRYFEPFLGGGAMFFYIKQKYNPSYCCISDLNKDLIDTFICVRDNPVKLIRSLRYFKLKNSKEFYYNVRNNFNKNKMKDVKRCAAFIYLNKTCFNGIYRVNMKGEFNVPRGKYENPEIYNPETILLASQLLQDVDIKCIDYQEIVNYIKESDFVYLDPCYDPLKKTSFTKYTPKSFSNEDNKKLAYFVKELKDKNVNVLLSNNVTENVEMLYPQDQFKKQIVYCSRSINSVSTGRGRIQEFLISNY
jgi:DNA adenine methylase